MRLLILGVKEYPYGSATTYEKHVGGGTGIYVERILKYFLKENIEALIVTRKFPKQKKYETINKNLKVYRVPFVGGKYPRVPTFNFSALLNSLTIVRKEKVDIIYSHGIFATCSAYILGKLFKVPIVSRPAGLAYSQWGYFLGFILKIMEKVVYSKVDEIVFLSVNEKNKFEKSLNRKFNNSIVIPTGIDTCGIKKNMPHDKVQLIFVGRLVPVKGINYLIKSFSLLPEDILQNIECTIAGDGRERRKLENLTKRLHLTKNFRFVGFQEDVYPCLSESDIFVLPSLSEGLPVALLEAMSMGLACIVTDIGLPFPNHTVYYVKVKDEMSLKEGIEKLVQDKKLRRNLGENAKLYVAEHHSWEQAFNIYLNVFNELLKKDKRRGI